MFRVFVLVFSFLLLFPLGISSIFASVDEINTNQSVYYEGDLVIISGFVSYDPELPSITIQILNPTKSDFAGIAFALVQPDGSFISDTIRTGGVKWSSDGTYTIKVTYDETNEKTLEYKKSTTPSEPTTPSMPTTPSEPTTPSMPTTPSEPTTPSMPTPESSVIESTKTTFTTLKLKIPNFPSFDKSPQYYIDRYDEDSNYSSWFDSQFQSYSINDVVGYKTTHVDNFPSLEKSPQYYLDRYNNEYSYKDWFDSQFPDDSLYNILGYEDPVSVPDWIRNNAEWWAIGEIDDSNFVSGIEFMLANNIIVVSNVPPSGNVSTDEIPVWVRNNAHWWSQDLISEEEFVNSLKFLIQEEVIMVN